MNFHDTEPAGLVIPSVQNEVGAMGAQTADGVRRRPRTVRQRMVEGQQQNDFDGGGEDDDYQVDGHTLEGSDEDEDLNDAQEP